MIRRLGLSVSLAIGIFGAALPALADCAVIDQLDKLHTIQTRLARDPDTALFATDIRQLRTISAGISDRATLDAVAGNRFTAHGAAFVRFLQNTRSLLQISSLDDPLSVRPHFDRQARENLAVIGDSLITLRCNETQIAIDAAIAAERGAGGSSDAEDLAEVAENLNRLAGEVLRPRTAIILLLLAGGTALALPVIKHWVVLRQRRAKRHNTLYPTQYLSEKHKINGTLIDINCHGVKLRHELDSPPPKGQTVEIAICDHWVEGQVMWSNAHYSGVQFRKTLSLSDVAAVCALPENPQMQNGAPRDAASQNMS